MASVPMTDADLRAVQVALAQNPEAGDRIPGTGGARKVRTGVKGKRKRGGARVIYYYQAADDTIYLLLLYGKDEADDLSEAGKRILRDILREL
jgi:mRNA-degrading endonuclease RelE of RelBE toxin-antitoxin system